MNVPEAVGVPTIVITLPAHEAVTPAGSPVGVPMPVALVVVCVMVGIAPPRQKVGLTLANEAVLIGLTLTTALPLTGVVHGLAPVTATLTNV